MPFCVTKVDLLKSKDPSLAATCFSKEGASCCHFWKSSLNLGITSNRLILGTNALNFSMAS
jgi:hypothetical protein